MLNSQLRLLDNRFLIYKRAARALGLRRTHSEVIDQYLSSLRSDAQERRVFVEVGAGLTTSTIAGHARRLDAAFYCCDINTQLLDEIADGLTPGTDIHFVSGDSITVLSRIIAELDRVDFVFLDSAPSALRTFHEFQILEPLFRPGSVLISDNASLPGTWFTFSACRKGRILVPYLLASPFWQVTAWPRGGDSMIAAVRHAEPEWSDPAYEWMNYPGDNWRSRVPASE